MLLMAAPIRGRLEPGVCSIPRAVVFSNCRSRYTVLSYLCKSVHRLTNLLLTSCFTKAGFTRDLRPEPEPSPPQAETEELTAMFLRFTAAFTSRSCAVPHAGQVHWRTESGSFSSLCPLRKIIDFV